MDLQEIISLIVLTSTVLTRTLVKSENVHRYRRNVDNVRCSTEPRGELAVYPDTVGMLGGEMLDIVGPCLTTDNPTIKCRFGEDDNFKSYGYKVSESKARCHVPLLTFRGNVKLELSVDHGPYDFSTFIQIALADKVANTLNLVYNGRTSGWNETSTKQLTVTWDGSKLTDFADARVKVELYGYRETTTEVEFSTLLSELGNPLAISGSFTFNTDRKMCTTTQCSYDFGFIKVSLEDNKLAKQYSYYIDITMLGFYLNYVLSTQIGGDWPSQKCKEWHGKDSLTMSWLKGLPSCPCNLQQALLDVGRFQMDSDCNMFTAQDCVHHRGAKHCVRSSLPTDDYGGNHCCYDPDGNLMYTADFLQGSSPDKSHTEGKAPFKRPMSVPTLSHWVQDTVPYYHCCLWSGSKQCEMYMELRPTVGCKNYYPPTVGSIFGQGHIFPFDGSSQRLCATGDFFLLSTTDLTIQKVIVQGRFIAGFSQGGVAQSVALEKIAVSIGAFDTVVLGINRIGAGVNPSLTVTVNGKELTFGAPYNNRKDFNVVTVIKNGESCTLILNNGMGMTVSLVESTDSNLGSIMSASIYLPNIMMNKTEGLLGNFNGKIDVEHFISPTDTSPILQYQQFQYIWGVNQTKDLILPEDVVLNTVPVFSPATCTSSKPVSKVLFCEDNDYCNFDFTATAIEGDAKTTLSTYNRIMHDNTALKPVRSCGLLDIPGSIKNNYNYTLGNVVNIQGCKTGEQLSSDNRYVCTEIDGNSQAWKPQPSPLVCAASEESVNTDVIIGVVIALVAVAILVVIAIIFIKKCRETERKYRHSQEMQPPSPIGQ